MEGSCLFTSAVIFWARRLPGWVAGWSFWPRLCVHFAQHIRWLPLGCSIWPSGSGCAGCPCCGMVTLNVGCPHVWPPLLQELEEAEARFRDHMSHSSQQKGVPAAGPAGRWEQELAGCLQGALPQMLLNAPGREVKVNQWLKTLSLRPSIIVSVLLRLCCCGPVLHNCCCCLRLNQARRQCCPIGKCVLPACT